MNKIKCSNRNCGWIGEESEQRGVRVTPNMTEMRCPRCDNGSFYNAKPGEVEKVKSGAQLIALERKRQLKIEGWTPEHDDTRNGGELADAGRCYAEYAVHQIMGLERGLPTPPLEWPWEETWWKPSPDTIRNLTKAGALIAAEIDRLQRAKK